MAMRKSGRPRRQGGSRVSRGGWLASRIYATDLSIGDVNQGIILGEAELADLGAEPTLLRTRGELYVSVPATGLGLTYLTVGLGVVDVSPLGTPPLLNPFSQPDDWYWWQSVSLVDVGGGQRWIRIEIDSKAMRRIHSGAAGGSASRKNVIVAAENDPASASPVSFSLTVYTLVRSS